MEIEIPTQYPLHSENHVKAPRIVLIINELKRRRISVVKCDIRFTTEPYFDLCTLFYDIKLIMIFDTALS